MNLSARILKALGWKMEFTVPDYDKCIYCVAPHTSNWDFVLGELAIHAVGRKAGFMMKASWFFFPLGALFRAIGGIPVERGKNSGMVDAMVERFNSSRHLCVAITPEGTRKKTSRWHTGFLRIAYEAKVPIVLAAIDNASPKRIVVTETFVPTGDIHGDIEHIKRYYSGFKGIKPENFDTTPQ